MKKMAFCITCMNRLHHLKETIVRNITDNIHSDVEFVLLDYNSTDGLEEWVKGLRDYIDSGVLNYYKTFDPPCYRRGHSRNMAFRLADAEIVCNLDADNYLGKDFASYFIELFETEKNTFYRMNPDSRDTFGRVCVRKDDFIRIRGYDEEMEGYGFEDNDLFLRLKKSGLDQRIIFRQEFSNAIRHTDLERISEESMNKNVTAIYINHINPYSNEILLLYEDKTCKSGEIVDNKHLNNNPAERDLLEEVVGDNFAITLTDGWHSGSWEERNNNLKIRMQDKEYQYVINDIVIMDSEKRFFRFTDEKNKTVLLKMFSEITNRKKLNENMKSNEINPDGFGKGVVYKNFNYNEPIVLS